jgi:hypothetical protein
MTINCNRFVGNMELITLESSLSWGQIEFHRWQKASWVASAAERYECSRLNGVQERTMAEFRCKMLNERGGTLFSADITADTLDGAIQHAAEVLHTSNLSSPSRRVCAFEVWSGVSRLFPPPLHALTGRWTSPNSRAITIRQTVAAARRR